jgi:ribonuclease HI
MEMTAVVKALEKCIELGHDTVTVYTDSNYVKMGLLEWSKNWERNGWKTSKGEPVKNKDLWIELDEAVGSRKINWEWVKGHAGNEGNEKADELANQGVISMMREQ